MNILKNKILFIILLFTLLIIIFSSNVSASTSYLFSDGVTRSLVDFPNDDNENFVIQWDDSWGYYTVLFYPDNSVCLGTRGSGKDDISFYFYTDPSDSQSTVAGHYLNYSIETNELIKEGSSIGFDVKSGSPAIYTNVDLSSLDGTEVFFSVAPPGGVKTMEIQQVEEIPQEMAKVTAMILPVCLGIFGILLVLYLIRSKNLLNL